MDKQTQITLWTWGLILVGILLMGKNLRDYKKKHPQFDVKTFSKAMIESIVIGNTMIFGIIFFIMGIMILIFS